MIPGSGCQHRGQVALSLFALLETLYSVGRSEHRILMIPPGGFEPPSPDPKSCMIDHYTTGVGEIDLNCRYLLHRLLYSMHPGIISVWSQVDGMTGRRRVAPARSRPLEVVLEPDYIVLAGVLSDLNLDQFQRQETGV